MTCSKTSEASTAITLVSHINNKRHQVLQASSHSKQLWQTGNKYSEPGQVTTADGRKANQESESTTKTLAKPHLATMQ